MHRLSFISRSTLMTALFMSPLLLAAKGEGCGGNEEGTQVAPNMEGEWSLTWEDDLEVEIAIGGAVYHETIGAEGGVINIDHEGTPITFDLDCSRPEVVCPSEVWPTSVSLDQRDAAFPRNVYVTIPSSECSGSLVTPDPAECGEGTNNETCAEVCDGEVTQVDKVAFGRLNNANDELVVLLGAEIATNGVNCALLGLSVAAADVETTGSGEAGDWEGVAFPSADVVTGYAGGCLWAGDVDDDGTIEALVLGAAVKLSTGFTGAKK